MEDHTIRPVAEYLVHGPIPAPELMDIDFLDIYVGSVVDTRLDIHFMLERVSVHGAPTWWHGTVPEFEQKFHAQYHQDIQVNEQQVIDATWQAASKEAQAGRTAPLPDDPTDDQVEAFLSQGRKRRNQVQAVETLMEMWVENHVEKGFL